MLKETIKNTIIEINNMKEGTENKINDFWYTKSIDSDCGFDVMVTPCDDVNFYFEVKNGVITPVMLEIQTKNGWIFYEKEKDILNKYKRYGLEENRKMKNKIKKSKEMIKALIELKNAFEKVCLLWEKDEKYFNNKMSDLFPFDESFDEVTMNVIYWTEESIENLEKK